MTQADLPSPPSRIRLTRLDLLRGLALIAMAIYHTGWDLEFFGYMEPGTTGHGGWKLFARCIASSFLFLVGFSLVLAHGNGIRWRSYGIRLAQIIAAALAITAATYFFTPESFVFFGILHQIAIATILGLAFIRLPVIVIVLCAAATIAAPLYLASPVFDAAWYWPLGLSQTAVRSNDYVPIFPWFGAVLAGIATARLMRQYGVMAALAGPILPHAAERPLQFIGRHSLAFYLIHQPVLISCVFLLSQIYPPAVATPHEVFSQACVQSCAADNETAFCQRFCDCVIGETETAGIFDELFAGKRDQSDPQMAEIAQICTQGSSQP
ncbi:DUF1624 domain-containing protein [Phyllobacterium sp. 21LDTY02-6]|uniref:heparan-alpha-glucosaminide N-acetyltransferase n=1 Tax=Phyllobacterium sp. 21LDTY02-6 TaxID=2944903 RepID=UPI002022070B|nr:heparan-alpha-glucosaminide N-acetyltransferase [Phyllobacterium sp. 21LDTY02-6]MCO4316484.1 DUF1624 domain-containing protein [Phyllobacterium sp. 21LDTY02-6]